ncbi:hypothetical protein ASL14_21465 [Paenibacillus sp. IHB B 3084]|uniref:hypothetical protein n=1 Tax=Paenibacillus sp. IHB B 3084 TaxID=867076 RepID=UPI000720F757|nr:hypothetical protein [Paenibacillus sp. IHB B 3084]ALP38363.1 hypothetical protein ASL14_21465 [Paenibacillus sp. IHB B 3084]
MKYNSKRLNITVDWSNGKPKNPDPKKKFDHTNHYRVNLAIIQRKLEMLGFSLEGYAGNDPVIHMCIKISKEKLPTILHGAFLQNLTLYRIDDNMALEILAAMKKHNKQADPPNIGQLLSTPKTCLDRPSQRSSRHVSLLP